VGTAPGIERSSGATTQNVRLVALLRERVVAQLRAVVVVGTVVVVAAIVVRARFVRFATVERHTPTSLAPLAHP
jgi:hypothetical protein